ncbi:amidase [Chitinasiproducens palmae]|uniref:Aspartyl-tRNA(Asn)/glutamyl-tRNA(Gln) amidotransferase subunit A n=1 Tax=Chitinasiproducens palmae TaxID=1770053 RepID=A0A1H2PUF3_9BURK|nr:amidase [Chitinasiproducens palmae]SDV50792.1 aspartyl-tRNA(Asn)/glutamyl-tRNA(Gln) amidotransferase subunit A [Chitinasiproducens palmae]
MDLFTNQTRAQLGNMARFNDALNAMILPTPDAALQDAARADAALARGECLGLLHGMTVSVKDNIDMAGLPTTAGARFLADNIAQTDAPVVARLRRAGAVIVGKANMAELAFGSRSFSAVGGQCRNPWDRERIPGGSSGGSAVSVAADFCTGSLGTDTGGSVRGPACYNGLTGLRVTHGRVPINGVVPVSEHNDTVGPIARAATDVARLFAVIAGYDDGDPNAVPPSRAANASIESLLHNFLPTLNDGIRGKRIGIAQKPYFEQLEAGVADKVMAAAAELERAGAVLIDVDLPLAPEVHAHASASIFSDVCSVFFERLSNAPETITASVVERMRHGLQVTGVRYAQAQAFRIRWRRQLAQLFHGVDLLLSPTSPGGAPLIDDGANLLEATRRATVNTYAGAYGGIPGISIPCGFSATGMPLGLQLEAAWWNEPLLLQAAVAYQAVTDFHTRRAPMLA